VINRLSCLGQLAIHRDGVPLSSAAAQPRRLALLAILARAGGRAVTREKLVSWLWPDADEERSRRSLNQALYMLRNELGGEEAILGSRDLRLNGDLIGSDVADFESAIESGRPEDAAALYAGPFLDGFHLSGLPELARWIEDERSALAQRHADLLEALAVAAESRGDPAGAVAWWRKAAGADPASARLTLRLMRALAASGDQAGALRQAVIYQTIVGQELELPPDPEVLALVERLRREPAATVSPAPSPPVRGGPVAPPLPPAPVPQPVVTASGLPSGHPRLGSRMLLLAGVGVLVLALLLIRPWRLRGREPASAGLPTVLVQPLENQTGDRAFDLVGAMVTDWVTQGLSATGLVQVVDTRTVLEEGASLASLVAETRPTFVLVGSVSRDGDSLRFLTRLTSPGGGAVAQEIAPVMAPVARPSAALEPLRQNVMGGLAHQVDRRLGNLAARASQPPTWEAYQEFLLGARDFGRDYEENLAHFQRAVSLDSAYWQARLWAGITFANLRRYPQADSALRSVAGRRDLLWPYDRANLDYFYGGFVQGDWETSYRGGRRMVELAPSAGHARWAWGLSARITHRPREALTAFGGIDLESGWARQWAMRILAETARVHHLLGDHGRELAAAQSMVKREPEAGWARLVEARALAAMRRHEELAQQAEEAAALPETPRSWEPFSPGDLLLQVGRELRVHDAPDSAARYLQAAIDWYAAVTEAGAADSIHLLGHARALYTAGRWTEAAELYRRLAEINPESPEFVAGVGLTAARLGDTATALATLAALRDSDQPFRFGASKRWAAHIAAALGQRELAVRLLARALEEGYARHYMIHSDPDFDSLRDYTPLQSLLRPRG